MAPEGRVTSVCVQCGVTIYGSDALCAHHLSTDTLWARNNRAVCEWLHRGRELPRLSPAERWEDLVAPAAVGPIFPED